MSTNRKNKLKLPACAAQSLIETIVATSIVTIALVGILSLALSTLSLEGQGAEWILAINLGREELEICQTIRSSNWFNENQSWPFGLDDGPWVANYDDSVLIAATADINNCNNCIVCFNPSDQSYFQADESGNCSGKTVTNYRRLITISSGDDLGGACSADCEQKGRVTVQWIQKNQTHSFVLEKRFTNWR